MGISRSKETSGTALLRSLADKLGPDAVAKRVGVTLPGLDHWLHGRRRPGADARVRMLEKFKIPLDSWELAPQLGTPAPPARRVKVTTLPEGTSAKTRLERHVIRLEGYTLEAHALVERHKEDPFSKEFARACKMATQLGGQYADACNRLARLGGELELTEAMIVRSTPFRQALRMIRDALVQFPEALRAVVAVLERYDATGAT